MRNAGLDEAQVRIKIARRKEDDTSGTKNFQMFKLDLEKAGEPAIKLPTSDGS